MDGTHPMTEQRSRPVESPAASMDGDRQPETEVMARFQETMRRFLETQRAVMEAYLGDRAAPPAEWAPGVPDRLE